MTKNKYKTLWKKLEKNLDIIISANTYGLDKCRDEMEDDEIKEVELQLDVYNTIKLMMEVIEKNYKRRIR